MSTKHLLTRNEAATFLGVSPAMISKAVRLGRLSQAAPGVTAGAPRFDPADLRSYLVLHSCAARRACAVCGVLFARKVGIQRYCSPLCNRHAVYMMAHGLPVSTPRAGYWMRDERRCAHCGASYAGLGKQRYCSTRCRVYAFWERHDFDPGQYTQGYERVGRQATHG